MKFAFFLGGMFVCTAEACQKPHDKKICSRDTCPNRTRESSGKSRTSSSTTRKKEKRPVVKTICDARTCPVKKHRNSQLGKQKSKTSQVSFECKKTCSSSSSKPKTPPSKKALSKSILGKSPRGSGVSVNLKEDVCDNCTNETCEFLPAESFPRKGDAVVNDRMAQRIDQRQSIFQRLSKTSSKQNFSEEAKYRCKMYKTTVTSWSPGTQTVLCPNCKHSGKNILIDLAK